MHSNQNYIQPLLNIDRRKRLCAACVMCIVYYTVKTLCMCVYSEWPNEIFSNIFTNDNPLKSEKRSKLLCKDWIIWRHLSKNRRFTLQTNERKLFGQLRNNWNISILFLNSECVQLKCKKISHFHRDISKQLTKTKAPLFAFKFIRNDAINGDAVKMYSRIHAKMFKVLKVA